MTHRRFRYLLAVDVTAAAIVAFVLLGVSLVAPDFLVGVLCVGVIPALVVGFFAWAAVTSRRRDPNKTSLTSPNPVTSPAAPTAAPTAALAPGSRDGRLAGSNPFVVTAYVDLAWLTHDISLHSYRVTRPGR